MSTTTKRPKSAPNPKVYAPHDWELADAAALQALVRGNASTDQQMRAIKWIIDASGTYDLPYRPDSARDTDFACGKQFVGKQIVKLINLNLAALSGKQST